MLSKNISIEDFDNTNRVLIDDIDDNMEFFTKTGNYGAIINLFYQQWDIIFSPLFLSQSYFRRSIPQTARYSIQGKLQSRVFMASSIFWRYF